jgi:hypothetical protein
MIKANEIRGFDRAGTPHNLRQTLEVSLADMLHALRTPDDEATNESVAPRARS